MIMLSTSYQMATCFARAQEHNHAHLRGEPPSPRSARESGLEPKCLPLDQPLSLLSAAHLAIPDHTPGQAQKMASCQCSPFHLQRSLQSLKTTATLHHSETQQGFPEKRRKNVFIKPKEVVGAGRNQSSMLRFSKGSRDNASDLATKSGQGLWFTFIIGNTSKNEVPLEHPCPLAP